MGFKKEVLGKLDELSKKQIDHTVEIAKYNIILAEHHVRTSNHEARIRPIEESHLFMIKLSKVVTAFVALSAGLAAIYHYLIK